MAVGSFTLYDVTKEKLVKGGTFTLNTDTVNAVLVANTVPLSNSFVGASGSARLSDITQITAAGYTANGKTVTLSITRSGGTVTVTSSDPTWANTAASANGVILYDVTATNKDCIGFMAFNATYTGTQPNDYTVDFANTGILTLS